MYDHGLGKSCGADLCPKDMVFQARGCECWPEECFELECDNWWEKPYYHPKGTCQCMDEDELEEMYDGHMWPNCKAKLVIESIRSSADKITGTIASALMLAFNTL